jgi:hypothetical protein
MQMGKPDQKAEQKLANSKNGSVLELKAYKQHGHVKDV